jgi:predicted hydrocarbon binding protein
MNSKANQTTVLITIVAVLLVIGGLTLYKIFLHQEKDDLIRSLQIEFQSAEQKIKTIFDDVNTCNLNLSGQSRTGFLNFIKTKENGEDVIAYEVGKAFGRLRIDQMKIDLLSEELNDSQIKLEISMSNATDEHSKKFLGIKEFKYEKNLRILDCPTEIVFGITETEAQSKCELSAPEGINGKALKIINQGELYPDFPYLIECRVCRLKNRQTIHQCESNPN